MDTSESRRVIEFQDRRNYSRTRKDSKKLVRIMVEVASNELVGVDLKKLLFRHLVNLDYVVVSDHRPDWVFSIIAFGAEQIIELSVVLRQFFRSTCPGTEMIPASGSEQQGLRDGGWVYESMKFHGLFGVPRQDVDGFLESLARDFALQHCKPFQRQKNLP